MTEIDKEVLEDVFSGILMRARDELAHMKKEDLAKFWFFEYDNTRSEAYNLYLFHDMLDIYGRKCRQWEEMHNGSMCVVERVRDTYLLPKIKEFLALHNEKVLANASQ